MQRFIVGAVGLIFWLVAIGLTVELVRESTQEQSVVAIGVAGLAIGMSGLGLLLARHAWTQRAYPEIVAGVAMWMAGVVCLGFIEISYWVSSYSDRYDQYSQERTAKQRRESLSDRDWKALTTNQVPASVAQLEASIAAKRMESAVARSANCAAITRLDSREPCRQYFELQSQLAAAQQRETLEARIKVDQPAGERKHFSANVFAAAEFAAKMRGGDVKDWAYIIIFWSWLLVTLVRDAGLLVMNPLGRRQKASTAMKAEEGQPSALTIHRPQREPLAKIAGVERRPMQIDPVFSPVAVSLPTIENAHSETINQPVVKPDVSPDPDGGTPVAIPDVRTAEHSEMFEIQNIVKIDGSEYEPPVKPGKRRRDEALHETAVKRFFNEVYEPCEMDTTTKGGWKSGGTPASRVRKDYEAWAIDNKYALPRGSHLGRYIAAHVDVAPSASGKRYACQPRQAKVAVKRRVA